MPNISRTNVINNHIVANEYRGYDAAKQKRHVLGVKNNRFKIRSNDNKLKSFWLKVLSALRVFKTDQKSINALFAKMKKIDETPEFRNVISQLKNAKGEPLFTTGSNNDGNSDSKDVAHLSASVNKLLADNKELNQGIEHLNDELKTAKEELTRLKSKGANNSAADATPPSAEVDELQKKVDALNEELTAIKKEKTKFEKKYLDSKAALKGIDDTNPRAQKEFSDLSEKYEQSANTVQQLNATNNTLKDLVNKKTTEIESLNKKIIELNSKARSKDIDSTGAAEKVSKFEEEIKKLNDDKNSLKREKFENEKQIGILERARDNFQNDYVQLKAQFEKQNQSHTSLLNVNTQYEALKGEMAELEKEKADLQTKFDAKFQEINKFQREIAQFKQDLSKLNREKKDLEERLHVEEKLNAENEEAANKQEAQYKKKLDEERKKTFAAKGELNQYKSANEFQRGEIERLSTLIDSLEKQLASKTQ